MTAKNISIKNATLKLGNKTLFKKLCLEVAAGEFIAVLGPNGAGKTSLLKILLGLFNLNSGSIEIFDKSPKKALTKIGYIPQQKSFDRDLPMRGRDLVRLGVNGAQFGFSTLSDEENKRINNAITEVDATHFADKPIGQLSGGEQQRLRIAQAIVNNPKILLCDEPLLSLDLNSQQTVAQLINQQRQRGTSVLFVTHEINPILPYADRVLYLVDGNWAIGTLAEIMTSKKLSELFKSPVDVLNLHGRIIVVNASEHTEAEVQCAHHQHQRTSQELI